ncbi:bifunctional diguanylate cyclase/phosphodiesterase [Microvirga lotononidis]|uniref:PAS domain S-box/diguanylate cyclase (GGDEF) domain-containing protein n=1 Tax=Microvirga lotononidis TaxID=864069 RepID=I4YRZ6_9HYPH|nr:bifunctional diguanylate cyclase/phosphodiesterase [Microvirga lotononidis]EIM26738.1 PAS domain S-box/diguanylate cyclase (GGDEF) domain-containing protein [Microvirga lotononidis]WQO31652.1 EAL domain-containing protein [Microvirga lotononidis]
MIAEDLLSSILESSIDWIEVLDPDARLLLMNRAGLRAMDITSPRVLVGQSWVHCWAQPGQEAARRAVQDALAGRAGRFQGSRATVNGTPRRWDVVLTLVRAFGGRPDRLLSIARDVTGQVDLAQELSRTGRRHRALAEASAAIIWRVTPDGCSLEGEGWDAFCGVAVEKGQRGWWLQLVHPADRERVSAAWHAALRDGEPYACEFRVRHVGGAYRWVADRGVPLRDEDGIIEEWVGTISDIHERKQAEEALRDSEERLRLALETTSTGIWDADLVTGGRQWTPETRRILGISAEAPVTRDSFLDCVHPDHRAEVESTFFVDWPAEGPGYSGTYRIIRADNGEERWVAATGRTLLDENERPVRKIGTLQDITPHKRAEEALKASEERLRLALHAGRMVAWERDLATEHVTRSPNALGLLGLGSGPFPDFLERVHPEDRPQAEALIRQADDEAPETVEFRYKLPGGGTLCLGARAERVGPNRLIGITFDITDRKIAEEQAWRSSNHDPLTGLPNRALFQQRLEQALGCAGHSGTNASLLLIDLDHFQAINDTLGHDAGDALLKETAARLSAMIRACDTVARFAGDQFMVLIVEPLTLEHAVRFAQCVTETLRQPFSYAGRRLTGRASIGIAAFPDHASRSTELMQDAEFALRHAKEQGRDRAVTYSPALRLASEQRVGLGRDVHAALARDEFIPHYQPKVCLATGSIVGFEALARWHHPTQGLLTPGYFGTAFADPELATAIGRQINAKVASDMRGWLDAGLPFGRVAVNLSPSAFNEPGLADELLMILEHTGVPARHFEVEVTETVFLGRSSDHASSILMQLHQQGVRIALDDFGTGYASLTHLKQFPVDHVKIDQSFVRELERDEGDEAIVSAIIGLCRKLSIEVTAEGVETPGQAQRLRGLGCHRAQGYLYAKPVACTQVPSLLTSWKAKEAI